MGCFDKESLLLAEPFSPNSKLLNLSRQTEIETNHGPCGVCRGARMVSDDSDDNVLQPALGHVMDVVFVPVVFEALTGGGLGKHHRFIRLADGHDQHRYEIFGQRKRRRELFGAEIADHDAAEPRFGGREQNRLGSDAYVALVAGEIRVPRGILTDHDEGGGPLAGIGQVLFGQGALESSESKVNRAKFRI